MSCGKRHRRHRGRHHREDLRPEGQRMDSHSYRRSSHHTLYRSRNGKIFGVCQGISDYFDLSVGWVRCGAIFAALFTGFYPIIGIYIVAALMMRTEPVLPLESEADAEFYQSYSTSRPMAIHRLKRTYDDLDRRIQRLESQVTAREYDWDARLNGEI